MDKPPFREIHEGFKWFVRLLTATGMALTLEALVRGNLMALFSVVLITISHYNMELLFIADDKFWKLWRELKKKGD